MYRITEQASLLPYNTFGMDVRAARLVEYDTVEDLRRVLPEFRTGAWWHVGRGSNLLFTGDYAGWVLHSGIRGIEVMPEGAEAEPCDAETKPQGAEKPCEGESSSVVVRVGAGEVWDEVVAWAVGRGLWGAENLSLIPGEMGAAAVQNIGAYGVELSDLVVGVEALEVATGAVRLLGRSECRYGYRASRFKEERGRYVVTHVRLRLERRPRPRLDYQGLREALPAQPTLAEVREAVCRIRRAKLPDPRELGNAGSFFKNPVLAAAQFEALRREWPEVPHYAAPDGGVKVPAGWLIEQCGWRGRSLGRAGVYERQCLVLVNRGGASPSEVVALQQAVVRSVRERFGIELEAEVNII